MTNSWKFLKNEIGKINYRTVPDILNGPDVGMIRTAKTEITMSPVVAKQLRDLIDKELQKYVDEKFFD